MTYFTPAFLQFFKELAANNHKDWFDANKHRFIDDVKIPFEAFVQEIIDRAADMEPSFSGKAKDAVFRIYRDVRFSKDKTPYKLQMSAAIAPGGRKGGMKIPGMYLELGPEHFRFYSGVYQPDKQTLHRMRQYIVHHSDELNLLVNDADFVQRFGVLRGERNKMLPKEFKTAAEQQPLLFNKQFYFYAQSDPEVILSEDLVGRVMDHFRASGPMRAFLAKAQMP